MTFNKKVIILELLAEVELVSIAPYQTFRTYAHHHLSSLRGLKPEKRAHPSVRQQRQQVSASDRELLQHQSDLVCSRTLPSRTLLIACVSLSRFNFPANRTIETPLSTLSSALTNTITLTPIPIIKTPGYMPIRFR